MGLLEYQAMPSLRDVAHEGVLYTFHLVIDQPLTRASAWCGLSGGMDRPSRTNSHPAGSLSSSQPGGPPCLTITLAFNLIDSYVGLKHVSKPGGYKEMSSILVDQ